MLIACRSNSSKMTQFQAVCVCERTIFTLRAIKINEFYYLNYYYDVLYIL